MKSEKTEKQKQNNVTMEFLLYIPMLQVITIVLAM